MDDKLHGGHKRLAELFLKDKDAAVLEASEQFAYWSLPTVFTQDLTFNNGKRAPLRRDYQSTGALLVNTLSSKIMNALYPQGAAFFRFNNSEELSSVISNAVNPDAILSKQASMELAASRVVFSKDNYATKTRAVKLLLVTGNALEYFDKETGKSHVYSVRDYTCRRDGSGVVLRGIIKERIAVGELPADFKMWYMEGKDPMEDVDLYTGIIREHLDSGAVTYRIFQEVDGHPIGEPSIYPENELPYIFLVWNLVKGEHYGRGIVEDYAGSFAKLSVLSEALALYEAEAARIVNLVSASAGTDIESFRNAECGEYVQTNAQAGTNPGVWAYEGGSFEKINALKMDIEAIKVELSRAFMYTGNTRDGERVTTYEIRSNQNEANMSLGESYSMLSDSWLSKLAPLYCIYLYPWTRGIFALKAADVEVTVGVSALFKANQAQRLIEATQSIALVLPTLAQSTKRTNVDSVIDSIMDYYGVVTDTLFYNKEQMQKLQEQSDAMAGQAQQAMQMAVSDPAVAGKQLGLIQ